MVEVIFTNFLARFWKTFKRFANFSENCCIAVHKLISTKLGMCIDDVRMWPLLFWLGAPKNLRRNDKCGFSVINPLLINWISPNFKWMWGLQLHINPVNFRNIGRRSCDFLGSSDWKSPNMGWLGSNLVGPNQCSGSPPWGKKNEKSHLNTRSFLPVNTNLWSWCRNTIVTAYVMTCGIPRRGFVFKPMCFHGTPNNISVTDTHMNMTSACFNSFWTLIIYIQKALIKVWNSEQSEINVNKIMTTEASNVKITFHAVFGCF